MKSRLLLRALVCLVVATPGSRVSAQARRAPLLPPPAVAVLPAPIQGGAAVAAEELDAISASGLFLGVIGLLGGAALAGLRDTDCDRACRVRTSAIGATAGAAVMIPIGAHIGNEGRGNLLLSMLATASIGAAGYGAASLLPSAPVAAAVFLTAPIQIVMATKIENWTGPKKRK